MKKIVKAIILYNDEKMEGIKHYRSIEELKEKITEFQKFTSAKISYILV